MEGEETSGGRGGKEMEPARIYQMLLQHTSHCWLPLFWRTTCCVVNKRGKIFSRYQGTLSVLKLYKVTDARSDLGGKRKPLKPGRKTQ